MKIVYCVPEMDDDAIWAIEILRDAMDQYEERTHRAIGTTRIIRVNYSLASLMASWDQNSEVHVVGIQSVPEGDFRGKHSRLHRLGEDEPLRGMYKTQCILGCDSWIAIRPQKPVPPMDAFKKSITTHHERLVLEILGIQLQEPRRIRRIETLVRNRERRKARLHGPDPSCYEGDYAL